jgi:hexosaminidase
MPASKTVVVEVWKDAPTLQQVVSSGLQALVAYPWYLDKQIPDPPSVHYEWVDTWQDMYNAEPLTGVTTNPQLVIGGEACMWGEQVDSVNIDSRIWPRAAGVSERLWSPRTVTGMLLASLTMHCLSTHRMQQLIALEIGATNAIPRLVAFRCRLAQRGIGAGPIAPDYCPLPANSVFSQTRI